MGEYGRLGAYVGLISVFAAVAILSVYAASVGWAGGTAAAALSCLMLAIMSVLLGFALIEELRHPVWTAIIRDEARALMLFSRIRERLGAEGCRYDVLEAPGERRIEVKSPFSAVISLGERVRLRRPSIGPRIYGLRLRPSIAVARRGLVLRVEPGARKAHPKLRELMSVVLEEAGMEREARMWR
ncbi:hypothetical protein B6U99_00910 [Candidatus Geothermarchaeota archaeon ex4572_27]|nr:MAG: hypothetical protein B6U99_00910 [Candidatus Geothermarchaeota archaeon ex4572_27]